MWLDQALLTPGTIYYNHIISLIHLLSVAVGFFFGAMSIMEGNGVSGAVERISEVSCNPVYLYPASPRSCRPQNYQPTLIRNW